MNAVVELHVEALDKFRRKSLDWRIRRLQVRVANKTDSLLLSDPLVHVTADARFVPTQLALDSAFLALMARITCELNMLGNFMRKVLKCFTRNTLRRLIGRFRRRQRQRRTRGRLKTGCGENNG